MYVSIVISNAFNLNKKFFSFFLTLLFHLASNTPLRRNKSNPSVFPALFHSFCPILPLLILHINSIVLTQITSDRQIWSVTSSTFSTCTQYIDHHYLTSSLYLTSTFSLYYIFVSRLEAVNEKLTYFLL